MDIRSYLKKRIRLGSRTGCFGYRGPELSIDELKVFANEGFTINLIGYSNIEKSIYKIFKHNTYSYSFKCKHCESQNNE